MKILVFSDSHGKTESMILTAEAEQPDVLFHLGDLWEDAGELTYAFPDVPLYRVVGNCDWDSFGLPGEVRVELEGVTLLLSHGHLQGIKNGYHSALSHAEALGAQVLLCGHTHVPLYQEQNGVQLMNPGSIRYNRTYGTIELVDGTALCAIHHLN